MKKIAMFLVVLLAAAPAMAVVTINAVQVGSSDEADIVVSWSGEGTPPRAFAIDVNVTPGTTIDEVTGYHTGESRSGAKGYGIFPASFNREIDADDPNWNEPNYTPVAEPCDLPGGTLGGLGTSGITLEMGSLYVNGPNAPTSPATLARIKVSASTTVCFALNVGRAGIVLEDGNAPSSVSMPCASINFCVVPDVVGQDSTTASANVTTAGYTPSLNWVWDDVVPMDIVISTSPVAGTAAACGSTVTIDVSMGPCVVPNVVGMAEAAAIATIEGAGFVAGAPTYQKHDTVPAGNVISQDPVSGGSPGCGTTVDIVVSLGPCIVPDVTDMNEAEAEAAIIAAGFVLGDVSYVNAHGGTALGDVNDQDPAPGVALCGSDVNIAVSAQCMKASTTPASIRTDWNTWGQPACWCYAKQCRGDADGILMGPYPVGGADLTLFKQCYLKVNTVLVTIPNGICCDFDHVPMGPYRVGGNDLTILKQYYLKVGSVVPVCPLSPNYNFWCVPGGVCP
jgi:beta-lactam-binding protein with PASTA domain